MTITLWDTLLPPPLQIATKRLAVSTPGSKKLHKHRFPSGFLLAVCMRVVGFPCDPVVQRNQSHGLSRLMNFPASAFLFPLLFSISPGSFLMTHGVLVTGVPVIPSFFCQLYGSHRNHGSPPQHSLYQHHGNQRNSTPRGTAGRVSFFLTL